jgi:hypothetical protein
MCVSWTAFTIMEQWRFFSGKRVAMNRPAHSLSALTLLVILLPLVDGATTTFTSFKPGQTWLADDGKHINCHGGGIYFENGTYYWFGESRNGKGVACYTSVDLYNWQNRGLVFTPDASISDITPGCIMERPKVIKCPSTGKYALWFHLEFAGEGYNTARVAACSSSTVLGPYKFIRSFRPGNNMSRDQTVFVDDDGSGYHFYSSRDNYDMRLHRLTDDFLNTSGQDTMILESNAHREAPAVFKYNGTYYLITSGATGWTPNAARYDVSTNIWKQPWTKKSNPCTGPGADSTFGGQSTFVFKVPGYADAYIFMADRWTTSNLANSPHIWLPITILANGDIQITWRAEWDLSVFGPPVAIPGKNDLTASPLCRYNAQGVSDRFFDLSGRKVTGLFSFNREGPQGMFIKGTGTNASRYIYSKFIFHISSGSQEGNNASVP